MKPAINNAIVRIPNTILFFFLTFTFRQYITKIGILKNRKYTTVAIIIAINGFLNRITIKIDGINRRKPKVNK